MNCFLQCQWLCENIYACLLVHTLPNLLLFGKWGYDENWGYITFRLMLKPKKEILILRINLALNCEFPNVNLIVFVKISICVYLCTLCLILKPTEEISFLEINLAMNCFFNANLVMRVWKYLCLPICAHFAQLTSIWKVRIWWKIEVP